MDKVFSHETQEKTSKKTQKGGEGKISTFQVASNVLDASTKIYSSRVDSVHSDTYRVLNGLNRTTKQNKEKSTGNSEDDEDIEAAEKIKKRKIVSLEHTLDSLANLNAKRLDMEFAVDPLFHKTAAAFDEVGMNIIGFLMEFI